MVMVGLMNFCVTVEYKDLNRRPTQIWNANGKLQADWFRRFSPSSWNGGALSLAKLHRFAMCYLRTALGDNLEPNILVQFWTLRRHRVGEGDRFPFGSWPLASSRALLLWVMSHLSEMGLRSVGLLFKVPIEESDP
jgi:hypothetical protein